MAFRLAFQTKKIPTPHIPPEKILSSLDKLMAYTVLMVFYLKNFPKTVSGLRLMAYVAH